MKTTRRRWIWRGKLEIKIYRLSNWHFTWTGIVCESKLTRIGFIWGLGSFENSFEDWNRLRIRLKIGIVSPNRLHLCYHEDSSTSVHLCRRTTIDNSSYLSNAFNHKVWSCSKTRQSLGYSLDTRWILDRIQTSWHFPYSSDVVLEGWAASKFEN